MSVPSAAAAAPPTPTVSAELAAFWCQALGFDENGSSWVLDCYFAPSALAAIRWSCDRATTMADQLDPEPAEALRTWVRDARRGEVALATCLEQGQTYRVAVAESDATYLLSLTPPELARSRPDEGSRNR